MPGFPFRRSSFSLLLFSQELLYLLDSGLSLVESMEALTEKEHHAESRAVLQQVMASLYEDCLYPGAGAFPDDLPAAVRGDDPRQRAYRRHGARAGASRGLSVADRCGAQEVVVTASIYPVLLIVVGGLVMLFLLGYVVPRFSTIYESSGDNLPWMSQMLLAWGVTCSSTVARSALAGRDHRADGVCLVPCLGAAALMVQVWRPASAGESCGFTSWRGSIARWACCCAAESRW